MSKRRRDHESESIASDKAGSLPIQIGLIGALGDMARLYIGVWLAQTGATGRAAFHIHACDHPSKYDDLVKIYAPHIDSGTLTAHRDGHAVSRASDIIIYSVESSNIVACIKAYAPSTKLGAIVAGQTSVKAQEIRAFEEFMPSDVSIISLHSMHGPSVSPKGQPLVLLPHRVTVASHLDLMHKVVDPFESKILQLSWKEHDDITADTQAVTHVAFLSMGAAWSTVGVYPWLSDTYKGTLVEEVKVTIAMRIYFAKWHVYAGLAVLNESARDQIRQFAKSAKELFELMIQEKEREFTDRVMAAAKAVFGNYQTPLLRGLNEEDDDRLEEANVDVENLPSPSSRKLIKPNSHLSIFAIVDSWYQTKTNPFDHLSLLGTPPFRLWLGISQHVFITPHLLNQSIKAALFDRSIRMDDLNFVLAVTEWSAVIGVGSFDGYREKFEGVRTFFEAQKESLEWRKRSDQLIQNLGIA
ncbi:Prephenate dehydrogenase-domain-containing protein [Chytriomyces cf. hyalinus JEL632]|nr:Prephenate dehydrogenase-domain-containing protein [Chytriomyces cf. hyalinus JEL632]